MTPLIQQLDELQEKTMICMEVGNSRQLADRDFINALVNAYPQIRQQLLAAERAKEAVRGMGEGMSHQDLAQYKNWRSQCDAILKQWDADESKKE